MGSTKFLGIAESTLQAISIQRLFGFDEYIPFGEDAQHSISIQRLFGFDDYDNEVTLVIEKFQYNDCLGSTSVGDVVAKNDLVFQYNDCLGSTGCL